MERPHRLLACGLLVLIPVVASAQAPPPPRHQETFEAAYVGVTGNAMSSTFSLGADIIARPDGWLVRHKAAFVRNESDDVLTAKAVDYLARVEHTMNPRTSVFGEYDFFRDRFAGVTRRNTFTGGVAYSAVTTGTQTLRVDAGLGYLGERRLAGADIASGSWQVGAGYKAKLSATAEITDDTRIDGVFSQADNWRVAHVVSATATLVAGLSLKVSYGVRFANFPPPGFKRTDTTTSFAVVAKFTH